MVVFDAVFGQIVDHLMQVARAGKDDALPFDLIREVDLTLLRHQTEHVHRAFDDLCDVDGLRRFDRAAVEPRQAQQILRDARQALRFLLNVADKLAHRRAVHVLGLQNRVGQQADARQRRFELMGRVGDETAASVLGGLQTIRHTVELVRDLRDLIVPADGGALAVIALAHLPDRAGKQTEAPRQHAGEEQAQHHDADENRLRDAQQRVLQVPQQRRLLGVVLIGVDRADGLAAVDDRRSAAALERAVVKGDIEHVVAVQSLYDLGIECVAPKGAVRLARVVEDASRGVGDQNAGDARLLRHRQRRGDVLLAQLLQPRQRRRHDGDAALERRLLGAEDQVLRHRQGVGVHQHQHRDDDGDIAQAELGLQTCALHRGASPQK